jgi:hypothetical protein
MSAAPPDVPELVIGDQEEAILTLLGQLQHAVLAQSEAARALFSALAREGRLFAQTEEGKRCQQQILRSALLDKALLVWQGATVWMSEETGEGTTPSAVIDALAAAARSPERERLLQRLFASGGGS